eukprot:TRINITY_DN20017_c0_g1_i1.p1 TRINITY_DN20017_c0_g1~~TRINITY_DN20017_c0_g1_i1.p1  ORF type:complete len:244 (+),score=24.61 TRINITY_DN20017_c0_g1_i1:488-1219(+)
MQTRDSLLDALRPIFRAKQQDTPQLPDFVAPASPRQLHAKQNPRRPSDDDSGQKFRWEWQDDQNIWHPYPPPVQRELEEGLRGRSSLHVSVSKGHAYRIDVANLRHIGGNAAGSRGVRRVPVPAGFRPTHVPAPVAIAPPLAAPPPRKAAAPSSPVKASRASTPEPPQREEAVRRPLVWEVQDAGKWFAYEPGLQEHINAAYVANRSNVTLHMSGRQYVLDFTAMEQRNTATGFSRRVRASRR